MCTGVGYNPPLPYVSNFTRMPAWHTYKKVFNMCNCKVLSYLKILHGVYVVNNRRTVLTNSVICNANGNGCRQPMFTGLLQTTHFGSRRNLVSKAIPATDLVLMGFCRKLSMCTQLHAQFLSTNTGSPREVCSGSCGVRPSEFEKQVQETRSKEIIRWTSRCVQWLYFCQHATRVLMEYPVCLCRQVQQGDPRYLLVTSASGASVVMC